MVPTSTNSQASARNNRQVSHKAIRSRCRTFSNNSSTYSRCSTCSDFINNISNSNNSNNSRNNSSLQGDKR